MLTYLSVDFCFDFLFQSKVLVSDSDDINEVLPILVRGFWEKCNGIIISSAKSVWVILREKKMKLGLLCVSPPENSVESCEVKGSESQMLVFSSISLLIKYIHSSSLSKHIGTEFSINVLSNTVNFSDAHQMRFLQYLQKFMPKLQEDVYIAKFQPLIEQEPCYICTVCHRLLYRMSVYYSNSQFNGI